MDEESTQEDEGRREHRGINECEVTLPKRMVVGLINLPFEDEDDKQQRPTISREGVNFFFTNSIIPELS